MDAIEQSGAFTADKRAVARAAKKSRLQELSNHLTRLIRVQVPQPLKLPVRQAQSGTLVELAADALEHWFEIGQAGHVAQGVALK
jgi:hypothetical protein